VKKRDIAALTFGAGVFPIRWDAERVDEIRRNLEDDDEDEGGGGVTTTASAGIDFLRREIILDPVCLCDPYTTLQALLHEGTHILDVALGMDLKETQVESLSFGIMSLLVQSGFIHPEDFTVAGVELKGKQ